MSKTDRQQVETRYPDGVRRDAADWIGKTFPQIITTLCQQLLNSPSFKNITARLVQTTDFFITINYLKRELQELIGSLVINILEEMYAGKLGKIILAEHEPQQERFREDFVGEKARLNIGVSNGLTAIISEGGIFDSLSNFFTDILIAIYDSGNNSFENLKWEIPEHTALMRIFVRQIGIRKYVCPASKAVILAGKYLVALIKLHESKCDISDFIFFNPETQHIMTEEGLLSEFLKRRGKDEDKEN